MHTLTIQLLHHVVLDSKCTPITTSVTTAIATKTAQQWFHSRMTFPMLDARLIVHLSLSTGVGVGKTQLSMRFAVDARLLQ